MQNPGSAQNGCRCLAILNEGERLFQSTKNIYMKANKGATEIKFCYPMFACEGKL